MAAVTRYWRPGRSSLPDTKYLTGAALEEALTLSAEIIRDIEASRGSLTTAAYKTSRLARLLNDVDFRKIMHYEVAGYPVGPGGKFDNSIAKLAVRAGRRFESTDTKSGETHAHIYAESISTLEQEVSTRTLQLAASGNKRSAGGLFGFDFETIRWGYEEDSLKTLQARLESRRTMIHDYATARYYELKFSHIVDDVFARLRGRVDAQIGAILQSATKRFAAVYENLRSENPEDWSNAVHGCRRILQDLADALFPATDQTRTKVVNGSSRTVNLGKENYTNRIMAFVEDSSSSGRFQDIVGSHLAFLGNRLDSVSKAAQKGSHSTIVSKDEADRYVVYTYLIVGDILSLCQK